ncbi:MAG: phytanoyl-CoA dioxygenase family protein [Candidatus Poribacteria bacterium]|nr:phytanoyl-CoA dioxygenase family protein [Candidatus Poribacteria bacterium]
MEITLCPEELTSGRMSRPHLDQAVEAIRTDGYVILENVVSYAHLDLLCEKMDADLQTLMTASVLPINFVKGHLQQDPPPFAPYVFRDVVANPFVVQVTRELLGDGLFNSFYSGNTNCPGSGTQPVHVDLGQLWRGLKVAHPAMSLVVNVAPMDVTEHNGSIELWPRSHLDTNVALDDATIKVDERLVEARRQFAPPVRGNVKKGSMLIRDMRLWHRGMPNHSDRPRQMIAMIHHIHWFRRGKPIKFNRGCEAAFENSDLDANVEFTDEPIDYIFRNRPYDYHEAAVL